MTPNIFSPRQMGKTRALLKPYLTASLARKDFDIFVRAVIQHGFRLCQTSPGNSTPVEKTPFLLLSKNSLHFVKWAPHTWSQQILF
ncbi:MAG: hypothetical protein ACD_73C00370G0001 [uncultured bacterium]|nr:MAG: hypothetical protein ACD_73C00370G0001 [uncultured bacterium]